MRSLLIGLLIIASCGLVVAAGNSDPGVKGPHRSLADYVDDDNRVLNAGAFLMNVDNRGYVGNASPTRQGHMEDPCTGEWAPQAQYPQDSSTQYLFQGGLWVGALIDVEGDDVPRVSVAIEGWQGDDEFTPASLMREESCIEDYPNCLEDAVYNPDGWAPQELVSTYTDTATSLPDGGQIDHPFDGPHVPLGIKVIQTSRSFSSVGYDKIAHFEYEIENVGENTLKDVYLGLYVDADIGSHSESGAFYDDDITGCRAESSIAYMMDNDGRPENVGEGNDFISPHALGVLALPSPEQDEIQFSYNWWVSSSIVDVDFGPAWTDDQSEENWTNDRGTPVTDAERFFILSNGEYDYPTFRSDDPTWLADNPQLYIDPVTQEESTHYWRNVNADDPTDLANGCDIRCLVSVGPFGEKVGNEHILEPGGTLSVSFALVFADSVHDADNPQESNTDLDPSKYDFSDLDVMADLARELHELKDTTPPPPAPYVHVSPGLSGTVLTWHASSLYEGTQFSLQRRVAGEDDWGYPITLDYSHYAQVDRTTEHGETYEYRAMATRTSPEQTSNWGPASTYRVGTHAAAKNLTAVGGDGQVQLSWDAHPPQIVNEYIIWRAKQENLGGSFDPAEIIASTETAGYVDDTVENGYQYKYAVQSIRDGVVSEPTETVTMPFGPDERMLIMLHSRPSGFDSWNPELLRDHFAGLDWGEADVEVRLVDLRQDTLSFPDIARYDVLWFELNSMNTPFSQSSPLVNSYLPLYLELGGHLAFSGLNGVLDLFDHPALSTDYPEWMDILEHANTDNVDYMPFTAFYQTPFALYWDTFDEDWLLNSIQSEAEGYPTLTVNADRHYFTDLPYGTGLTTAFLLREDATVLYTLDFDNPEVAVHQSPGAVIWHGEANERQWGIACVGVPMYYLIPDDDKASVMLHIADDLRTGGGIVAEPDAGLATADNPFALQVHPNPSNMQATLHFSLPTADRVTFRVYNVLGREVMAVAARNYQSGTQAVSVTTQNLTSGLYFVQMETRNGSSYAKMLVVK